MLKKIEPEQQWGRYAKKNKSFSNRSFLPLSKETLKFSTIGTSKCSLRRAFMGFLKEVIIGSLKGAFIGTQKGHYRLNER